ncbi:MAG TPA: hypothetical protein VHE30_04555 [Polyangiaceae bacterium]|nr:hypothetical protein [Polyangiaceae bacterium]
MSAPLLRFHGARIEAPGAAPLSLDFEIDGQVVLLSGSFGPLLSLATGEARLAAGSAEILGTSFRDAVRSGKLGVVPDLEEPTLLSVRDVLRASALLRGAGRGRAKADADAVLAEFGWTAIQKKRFQDLGRGGRRAVAIGCAALGGVEVVLVPRPFANLDDQEASVVERALEVVTRKRRLLVSLLRSADTDGEARLVATANAIVTLRDGVATVRRSFPPPPPPSARPSNPSVPEW